MSGLIVNLFGLKPLDPPNTNVPPPVVIPPPQKTPAELLVIENRKWLGVKEVGNNGGKEVEMFQKAVDGVAEGEPYCMAFQNFCIKQVEKLLGVKSEIYRSESCLSTWRKSPAAIKSAQPTVGALVLWQHGTTSAGHVGIITEILSNGLWVCVEGNTGSDNKDEKGQGVYIKLRNPKGHGTMHALGFIRPFG